MVLFFFAIAIFGYKVYRAFYPTDDFYLREFNENTGVELPATVSIKAKTATFPDVHGSYTACAVLMLPEHDFLIIKELIAKNQEPKFASLVGNYLMDTEKFFMSAGITHDLIESQWIIAKKHQIKIGFLKDNKTIVFERHSS